MREIVAGGSSDLGIVQARETGRRRLSQAAEGNPVQVAENATGRRVNFAI
ncbi:MAG: hypothetical protein ABFC84_11360 [Veillonellales bacterium]